MSWEAGPPLALSPDATTDSGRGRACSLAALSAFGGTAVTHPRPRPAVGPFPYFRKGERGLRFLASGLQASVDSATTGRWR